MRIDAHQHFWHYNTRDFSWMDERMGSLQQDYLPEDLFPQLNEAGINGTIAVQARRMIEETEFLLGLSENNSWIRGVVGWIDFTAPDREAQLERLSASPKLCGVREVVHDMPDPEYSMSTPHRTGVGLLASHSLTYDLLLKPQHIDTATRLVDCYPEQLFVIDHIAKPGIAAGEVSPWKERMQRIAERGNVFCKLSGMVTEANWNGWTREQFYPYLDLCLEFFGPQRLMIGSDWPVCTLAGSYGTVMELVIEYTERLGSSERDAVLGETCRKFYAIEDA